MCRSADFITWLGLKLGIWLRLGVRDKVKVRNLGLGLRRWLN